VVVSIIQIVASRILCGAWWLWAVLILGAHVDLLFFSSLQHLLVSYVNVFHSPNVWDGSCIFIKFSTSMVLASGFVGLVWTFMEGRTLFLVSANSIRFYGRKDIVSCFICEWVLFEAVKLSTIIANNRAAIVVCTHFLPLWVTLLERNLLLYRWRCNLLLFAASKPLCCSRKQKPRNHEEFRIHTLNGRCHC
jgi:hypothetical protein